MSESAPVRIDVPAPSRARQGRRVPPRLMLAALLFCAVEFLIFRSGFYVRFLEPDSTAGSLEAVLRNGEARYRPGTKRVLALGDSRMALLPRVADGLAPRSGYWFDRISVAGTHPRCWYYMLREIDPHADKYSAIVIPMDSYEDEDWEDLADAEVDIHYLVPLLRVTDAFDFSLSFESWSLRRMAFEDALFKGLAYKRDLWAFWNDPRGRMFRVNWKRRYGAQADYNFIGPQNTMEGLEVDWNARQITRYPPSATPQIRKMLDDELLRPAGQYTGRRTAYLRQWLGRIAQRYRGSRTRLIFFRLPRGPVVRPYTPYAPTSAVREIAARGEGILIDEHRFDELERPALFHDAVHLNEAGCEQFTAILVQEVAKILGGGPAN